MPISLAFSHAHLSIVGLNPITIPDFTVLTGLNGSGKTHLLQAMLNRSVKLDILRESDPAYGPSTDIRYYDWTTLSPGMENQADTAELAREIATTAEIIHQRMQPYLQPFTQQLRSLDMPPDLQGKGAAILRMSVVDLQQWLPDSSKAEEIRQRIHEIALQLSRQVVRAQPGFDAAHAAIAKNIEKATGVSILALTKNELARALPSAIGATDVFLQPFSRLFTLYRDLLLENDLKAYQKDKGVADADPLSKEEFQRRYNTPPWQFVNQALERAGLDFEFDHPELFKNQPYKATLRKRSNGTEVDLPNLSSGEKVLMALVGSLYFGRDHERIASFPKLVLLDEIDATLHPSMARLVLDVIKDTIVGKYGIKVIMTTHAPTTVALAPDESLYVMTTDAARLQKTTKSQALSTLLRDVPILSLDYQGRRQVFVESDVDAEIYDFMYQRLRPGLPSERSLAFIAVGSRGPSGDVNAGSAQVKRVVAALESGGNRSVQGILDWDGTNDPTSRLKVIAHKGRNGLENCIFDPLAIALLIARDHHKHRTDIGLEAVGSLFEFKNFEPNQIQQVVDKTQQFILDDEGREATVECSYQGGLKLNIRQAYLEFDDHKLEDRLKTRIPALNSYRNAGTLMKHIVQKVYVDCPEFVPDCFQTIFSDLLLQEL